MGASRNFVVLLTCWWLIATGHCLGERDDPGRFGVLATSDLFKHANYLSENSFFLEAIAEYERVAKENIGTEIEATARLLLAHQLLESSAQRLDDPAAKTTFIQRAQVELASVHENFPETRYSFVSRVMLIEGFGADDWQRDKLDQIFIEYGFPTFSEILSDDAPPFHESMVAADLRADLSEAYETQRLGLKEPDQAKLATFLVASFPVTKARTGGSREFLRRKVREVNDAISR